MDSPKKTDVRILIQSLKGQKVRLPDLHNIFADWTEAVNPEVERMREDVSKRLKRQVLFCINGAVQSGFYAVPPGNSYIRGRFIS